jgi:hypothetical protein
VRPHLKNLSNKGVKTEKKLNKRYKNYKTKFILKTDHTKQRPTAPQRSGLNPHGNVKTKQHDMYLPWDPANLLLGRMKAHAHTGELVKLLKPPNNPNAHKQMS